MPQISFPHILSSQLELRNKKLRVVTDKLNGNSVYDPYKKMNNPKTSQVELFYEHYVFEEIQVKRKAKGNWSKWDTHPTYFDGIGYKSEDLIPESEITNS